MIAMATYRIREIEAEFDNIISGLQKKTNAKDPDIVLAFFAKLAKKSDFCKIQKKLDMSSAELSTYFELLQLCDQCFVAAWCKKEEVLLQSDKDNLIELAQRFGISVDPFLEWVQEKVNKYRQFMEGKIS